jgi:hypothetical protein
MPLFRLQNQVVLFVHIPKTGGHALGESFKAAGAKLALYEVGLRPFSQCELPHMQAEVLQRTAEPGFYDFAFAVCRNPYDRLASEYRMQSRNQRQPPFDVWVREVLKACRRDPYVHDNHIRPQHEFVFKDCNVLRYENGLEEVQKFLSKRGVEVPKPPDERREEQRCFDVATNTVDRIRRFYTKDFAAFGYDPGDLSPLLSS